jgi:hypothetical protein
MSAPSVRSPAQVAEQQPEPAPGRSLTAGAGRPRRARQAWAGRPHPARNSRSKLTGFAGDDPGPLERTAASLHVASAGTEPRKDTGQLQLPP